MTATIPAAILSVNTGHGIDEIVYTCVLGNDATDQEGSEYNNAKYSERSRADSIEQLARDVVRYMEPNFAAKQLRAIADALDALHEMQCMQTDSEITEVDYNYANATDICGNIRLAFQRINEGKAPVSSGDVPIHKQIDRLEWLVHRLAFPESSLPQEEYYKR